MYVFQKRKQRMVLHIALALGDFTFILGHIVNFVKSI